MSRESCSGKDVARRAGEYFGSGCHCAEAVVRAVLEARGLDSAQAMAHATPFGGGVGRSFSEMCGALSGGLIAIGQVHGRSDCSRDWSGAARMGSELRKVLADAHGTTACRALLDGFGEDGDAGCARVVTLMAEAADDLLGETR